MLDDLKKGKGLDNNFCSWLYIKIMTIHSVQRGRKKKKKEKKKKMKANTYEDYCTEKLDTTPSQK